MDTMQADALRRAREMHENTHTSPRRENASTQSRTEKPPVTAPAEHSRKGEHYHQPEPSSEVSALFADKEKLLILSLILILCTEEKSDPALTLALLYLII